MVSPAEGSSVFVLHLLTNKRLAAAANHFDVVLIDTAGRMQDNEPLMRALAKLVSVNQPDKIIFVGEALVGNEAVDQLTKFNQALKDFSGMQNPRHIDGMILTKFDTIDDKVTKQGKRKKGTRNKEKGISEWRQGNTQPLKSVFYRWALLCP